MDVPSQPTLTDWLTPAGTVPAILVPTKTGNLFVLDRRNGQLLVPAAERPVPQGAAPGDHVSPTQPFSDLTFRPDAEPVRCRHVGCHDLRPARLPHTIPSAAVRRHVHAALAAGHAGVSRAISACSNGVASRSIRCARSPSPIRSPFRSSRNCCRAARTIRRRPNAQHPAGSEIGVQPMYGAPYRSHVAPVLFAHRPAVPAPALGIHGRDRSADDARSSGSIATAPFATARRCRCRSEWACRAWAVR